MRSAAFPSICLLLFTLVFFDLSSAFGKDVHLFNSYGNQVRDYRQLLDGVQPGDEFVFARGRYRFRLIRHLGHGYTTEVFHVEVVRPKSAKVKQMALRLPINLGGTSYERFRHTTPFVQFIEYYTNKKERNMFIRRGIRVPRIYHHVKEQFVAVELVQPDFSLDKFMHNSIGQSAAVLHRAEEKLYEFVRRTTDLDRISDFRGDQLHYDSGRDEWILLDYTTGTRAANPYKFNFNRGLGATGVHIDYEELSHADANRARQIQQNIDAIYYQNESRVSVIRKRCSDFFRQLGGGH